MKKEVEENEAQDSHSEILSLQQQDREMIARVYHFLKEEYEFMTGINNEKCDLSPLCNIIQRTANSTGVSIGTVALILKEDKNLPSSSFKFISPMKKRAQRKNKGTSNEIAEKSEVRVKVEDDDNRSVWPKIVVSPLRFPVDIKHEMQKRTERCGIRGKVLDGDARNIVYNVIKYFEEEKKLGRCYPLEHSNARASLATGLSKNTITRIKKEEPKNKQPAKSKHSENNGKNALMKTEGLLPTKRPIKIEFEDDDASDNAVDQLPLPNGKALTKTRNSKNSGKDALVNTRDTLLTDRPIRIKFEDDDASDNAVDQIPLPKSKALKKRRHSNNNDRDALVNTEDPLLEADMVFQTDKPEIETPILSMVLIKKEDDDSYEEPANDSVRSQTSSSSDDEVSSKNRSRKKKKKIVKKPKKQNKQPEKVMKKENTEKAKKITRKWSYYSDDGNEDDPPLDPYNNDSGSDEWEPKVNVEYLRKVESALKSNKKVWINPENMYLDD